MNKALESYLAGVMPHIPREMLEQLSLDEILEYQHAVADRKFPAPNGVASTDASSPSSPDPDAEARRTERYQTAVLVGKTAATTMTLIQGIRESEVVVGFGVSQIPEKKGYRAYIRIVRNGGYFLTWGNGDTVGDALTSAGINLAALNITPDKFRR